MLSGNSILSHQGRNGFKWCLAPAVLFICLAVGCGGGSSGSVSGTVTFKGKPIVQGDVTFFQPKTGRVSQSPLDAEGSYTLNFSQASLDPGEYRVTVTPTSSYELADTPHGRDFKLIEKGGKSIPKLYRDRRATPLSATVTGGDDTFDFELK